MFIVNPSISWCFLEGSNDSHACTFDGCRVDCFFPLLLWLLAATTCGLTRTLLMDKLLFAVEFL